MGQGCCVVDVLCVLCVLCFTFQLSKLPTFEKCKKRTGLFGFWLLQSLAAREGGKKREEVRRSWAGEEEEKRKRAEKKRRGVKPCLGENDCYHTKNFPNEQEKGPKESLLFVLLPFYFIF